MKECLERLQASYYWSLIVIFGLTEIRKVTLAAVTIV